jgi:hypothetical protein
MIESKLSRKVLFSVVNRRLRWKLVDINVDGGPRRVQELNRTIATNSCYPLDTAFELLVY